MAAVRARRERVRRRAARLHPASAARLVTRAFLDRLELLHDDLVADASALVALIPAPARAWRPHALAASIADVLALLDAVTARALDHRDPAWLVRLSTACDPLRVRGPWLRGESAHDAPARFLARPADVRARVNALRTRGAPSTHAAEVRTLARLLARQRRLLDAALGIAERGGHLVALASCADDPVHPVRPVPLGR
jgi:hypothetical protein